MPTFSDLFELAVRHHQNGNLQLAESFCRQVIQAQPTYAAAYHLLGLIAHQAGDQRAAANLLRQAIQLDPSDVSCHFNLAIVFMNLGQQADAIACYQEVLRLEPGNDQAWNNLGNLLRAQGHLKEAVEAFRQAVDINPANATSLFNLGTALKAQGHAREAANCFRKVLAINPQDAAVHRMLGSVLLSEGALADAENCFRQAIAIDPYFVDAQLDLGNVFKDQGRLAEAEVAYRQVLRLKSDHAGACNNLGIVLGAQGKLAEAAEAYRAALAIEPGYADAHYNLGIVYKNQGRLDDAAESYRKALKLNPRHADAQNNLGTIFQAQGRLADAVTCYRQALLIYPDCADACNNLGIIAFEEARLNDAVSFYKQARALQPAKPSYHSNLLHCLIFHPDYDGAALLAQHRTFDAEHAAAMTPRLSFSNDRSPDRRLRVGYISPDFRDHCQALFTVPLFGAHDHTQVEVFCYADVLVPDGVTQRLRRCADSWQSIAGVSDEAVAQMVHQDRIDILVDLTMHMARNRLLVFARKPAPVQVCWLAYPGTTGLRAMNYRLSDPHLDPPDGDHPYSEETVRLPHTFWCYNPLTDAPMVNELPALKNGYVTFGCLNNFCKVNDSTLRLWSKVLQGVPSSRLLLLAPETEARGRVLRVFDSEGISPQTVTFLSRQPRRGYLELYHQIDIGLDTLPYNGHTTSLDSYWMGVPVITLVGETVVGRAGLSQLTNLGLTELSARTSEEFVERAAALASDLSRLQKLRSDLRDRMAHSPLMDAQSFARGLENAYREMWRRWCAR